MSTVFINNLFTTGIVIGITDEGQYTVKLSDNSTVSDLLKRVMFVLRLVFHCIPSTTEHPFA